MSSVSGVKAALERLTQQHREQRVSIGVLRKTSKTSAVWILEGMSLALLSRAIKQFEASDIVMYELVAKARLAQEVNLMIRHLLSPEAERDASRAWSKAVFYYFDKQEEIKYRQYKGKAIYDGIEKAYFNITSLWSHASYDNARTSFMYLNNNPSVYNIDHRLDNSIYDNMRWIMDIKEYTERSFAHVQEYLDKK